MKIGEAMSIIGSLSFPTKMPGTAYDLPASACVTGSKLAKIQGTACSVCYANKGRYGAPNVVKAQHRRLDSLSHPRWADAMVVVLDYVNRKPFFRVDMGVRNAKANGIERFKMNESGWHRWHSSGDLQSVEHLTAICEIAARLPWIRFWMPTNELGILRTWRSRHGEMPENLTARVSSIMINGSQREWSTTSVVMQPGINLPAAHICPAPTQGNQCGSCRACWSRDVPHVAYAKH